MNGEQSAFPVPPETIVEGDICFAKDGMSLRQYAAIAAMQGLLANREYTERGFDGQVVVEAAVRFADGLMRELGKEAK